MYLLALFLTTFILPFVSPSKIPRVLPCDLCLSFEPPSSLRVPLQGRLSLLTQETGPSLFSKLFQGYLLAAAVEAAGTERLPFALDSVGPPVFVLFVLLAIRASGLNFVSGIDFFCVPLPPPMFHLDRPLLEISFRTSGF